jgi:hypothetical protein
MYLQLCGRGLMEIWDGEDSNWKEGLKGCGSGRAGIVTPRGIEKKTERTPDSGGRRTDIRIARITTCKDITCFHLLCLCRLVDAPSSQVPTTCSSDFT